MGSKIRELDLGTYDKNVSRTYNWKISITKFPQKIRDIIKSDFPKLYSRIGGDNAPPNLLLPVNAFCTSMTIPRMSPDPISVNVASAGTEVAGVFTFYNFTGEFIIDAPFDFIKVFQIWGTYCNLINGLHNYTCNLVFEKLNNTSDGKKEVVARYKIPHCWAKEVGVINNDSQSGVSTFNVSFSSVGFDLQDT